MKRKLGVVLIGAGVLVMVAWLALSPILTGRALVRAAQAGDEAALARLVDFPAFRASLKDELGARLNAELRARFGSEDSALGGLGMLLAPSLVSGAVDALVTPQAIAAMVRSGQAPASAEPPSRTAPGETASLRQSWRYRGLNTFAVILTDPGHPDEPLVLLLERRGLFAWRLAGVDLTPDD